MSLLPFIGEFSPLHSLTGTAPISLLDVFNLKNHQLNRSLGPLNRSDNELVISTTKDHFQASIDVQQFKPEEIIVKLTGDKEITVEGKHEEREDEHGYIYRHFVRKYVLPDEFDAQKLQSKLSSDGVLNIIAPKKPEGNQGEYREIPITLTGPVKTLGQKVNKKLKSKRLRKGAHSIN